MQAESRQCLSSNVKCQRNLVTWAGLWFYRALLSNLLSAYISCVSSAGSTGSCETNSEPNLQHMICNTDTPPRILLLKLRQKYENYPPLSVVETCRGEALFAAKFCSQSWDHVLVHDITTANADTLDICDIWAPFWDQNYYPPKQWVGIRPGFLTACCKVRSRPRSSSKLLD